MTFRRHFSASALVLLFAFGCHDDNNSVTGPPVSPAATPTPPPTNTTAWTVVVTIESATGDACASIGVNASYIPVPGYPWDVIRNGSSIVLRYLPQYYPIDHTDYTGTLSGPSFTASRLDSFPPSSWTCANGQTVRDPVQTEQLSGTFAADDRSFDAVEIETWRLSSGEEATIRRHWVGTRL
jgi:hypothetical protein